MIVYKSALIPRKLPCPKKFLVTHQNRDGIHADKEKKISQSFLFLSTFFKHLNQFLFMKFINFHIKLQIAKVFIADVRFYPEKKVGGACLRERIWVQINVS